MLLQRTARVLAALALAILLQTSARAVESMDFKAPPHDYWQRALHDPATVLLEKLQRGEVKPDTSSNLAFLRSLLTALKVPVTSQLLVYSATSLQSGLIRPTNPRALYFNENTYVGFVPGGRVELIGIDPDLGAIFYIFNPLRPGALPAVERSTRCMNCHAGIATNRLPGLVAESVTVSMDGGGLETYRHDETGHQIPLDQRFGGWHLTGLHHLSSHHGNILGALSPQGLRMETILPGRLSDLSHYPLPTSDILPHLIHEHQLGFVNRVMNAAYLARTLVQKNGGRLDPGDLAALDEQAHLLTRYVLFADEAALPPQGVQGDPGFVRDFLQNRKPIYNGASLRDLDLQKHIFRYRCSYMIYTPQWTAMPSLVKDRVYAQMQEALREDRPSAEYAYLSVREKYALRVILTQTLPEWSARHAG